MAATVATSGTAARPSLHLTCWSSQKRRGGARYAAGRGALESHACRRFRRRRPPRPDQRSLSRLLKMPPACVDRHEMLVSGSMMRHTSRTWRRWTTWFVRLKAMCLSLGEEVVRPLANDIDRCGDRVAIACRRSSSFGPAGRRRVDAWAGESGGRRATSCCCANSGARSMPELTGDAQRSVPQIQREAVRAILNIGSRRAYEVLPERHHARFDRIA